MPTQTDQPQDKRALLKALLQKKASANGYSQTEAPLSYGQQSLWFLQQNAPQSDAYNVAISARIRSAIEIAAWQQACQQLVNRHPILRTTYHLAGEEVVQRVHTTQKIEVKVHDVEGLSPTQANDQVHKQYSQSFDLVNGPIIRFHLFRKATDNYVLLINIHHIAGDGFSTWVLLNELRQNYSAALHGMPTTSEVTGKTYIDFVHAQRQLLTAEKGKQQLDYWKESLQAAPPVLDLPVDKARPATPTYRGASADVQLDDKLVAQLRAFSKEQGVTLFVTLVSAFQWLMSRYSGQEDVIVGTPTSGRASSAFQEVIGYFVNPVPLRAKVQDQESFSGFLKQNRERVLSALTNADLPFPYLVEQLQIKRDKGRTPLFQVFFSLLKSQGGDAVEAIMSGSGDPHQTVQWGDLALQPYDMNQQEGQFDLTLALTESEGRIHGKLKYSTDLYEAETVQKMVARYNVLLQQLVHTPDLAFADVNWLTAEEEQLLIHDNNNTTAPFPAHLCMHELFEQRVDAQANDMALSMPVRNASYTYQELDAAANQWAHYLQQQGVKPEQKVGICLHRSPDMVVAILAVLKAGGAYVPLDPEYPTDRIQYIAQDAGLTIILSSSDATEQLEGLSLPIVLMDNQKELAEKQSTSRPTSDVQSDSLAYIIYTSGSTGKPKGVLIEHSGVINKIINFKEDVQFGAADHFTLLASYAFDASIGQLFMPLCNGYPLYLMSKEQQNDPASFWDFYAEHKINVLYTAASLVGPMIETSRDLSDVQVDYVFLGAEKFPVPLYHRIVERLDPHTIVNMYGPTETTVNCVMHTIKEKPTTYVPLGKPLQNYTAYILDEHGKVCPIGITGEIHVGGVAVARGYHERPEQTAERFIADPFSDDSQARLYKSGDLAKYLPNGDMVFMGRTDRQVKVNGYRIEPGEIENAMSQQPEVKQAVVIARTDANGNDRLVGYMTLAPNCQAPTIPFMREQLQASLPSYMVPSAFVTLDEFPLTPTGKIDEKALPEPGLSADAQKEYVAPSTEAEKHLTQIWQTILDIPKIGVHDNFFELGGASVQSIQVVNRANAIGFQLDASMMFEYQTIKELAAAAEDNFSYQEAVEIEAPKQAETQAEEDTADLRPSIGTDEATTLVESIGTYLPSKTVPTQELVDQVRVKMRFPIEKMTGIKTRRMAGDEEFAIDIARKAMEDCFSRSRHKPADIEVLICCNISRFDAPDQVSFEPSSAAKLARHFGMNNPLIFDLSNACATMWTGINLADAMIANGSVQRAMVASGEYITHISKTAIKEIEDDFMDRRMACLTVGDSGAAVILEKSPNPELGFHFLHMFTETDLCRNCIAHMTDRNHGGAIMYVESVKAAASAIAPGAKLALEIIQKGQWLPEPKFDHILIHQTSSTTISDARREINSLYNQQIATKENTIDNIAHRGNTATTSHWLAVNDRIRSGDIKAGQKMVFGISGSGHTLGTALYSFDDLPNRLRENRATPPLEQPLPRSHYQKEGAHWPLHKDKRVSLASVATLPEDYDGKHSSMDFVNATAAQAIEQSGYHKNEIGLIIHTGIYRDLFLNEPAVAALMAGDLGINLHPDTQSTNKSFTFDLLNGSIGFLQACFMSIQMLQAGKFNTAMVTTSEIENSPDVKPLGIQESAAAVVLHPSEDGQKGFGNFAFEYYAGYLATRHVYGTWHDGEHWLEWTENAQQEAYYADCISQTVQAFLEKEGLNMADIQHVFPPQISPDFARRLSVALDLNENQLVDASREDGDYFSASLGVGLKKAEREGRTESGDVGLLISVAGGIQVGCALYYF